MKTFHYLPKAIIIKSLRSCLGAVAADHFSRRFWRAKTAALKALGETPMKTGVQVLNLNLGGDWRAGIYPYWGARIFERMAGIPKFRLAFTLAFA